MGLRTNEAPQPLYLGVDVSGATSSSEFQTCSEVSRNKNYSQTTGSATTSHHGPQPVLVPLWASVSPCVPKGLCTAKGLSWVISRSPSALKAQDAEMLWKTSPPSLEPAPWGPRKVVPGPQPAVQGWGWSRAESPHRLSSTACHGRNLEVVTITAWLTGLGER